MADLSPNQKMILSVRRAIWMSRTPGLRERPDCAEFAFAAGFMSALDQVSPVLEGKIDADALAGKLDALIATLSEDQRAALGEIIPPRN